MILDIMQWTHQGIKAQEWVIEANWIVNKRNKLLNDNFFVF